MMASSTKSSNGDVSHNHSPGWTKTDDIWIVRLKQGSTSVHSTPERKASFDLYPNPVRETLHLLAPRDLVIEQVAIRILDGRILLREKGMGVENPLIQVGNLLPGLYLLEARGQDGLTYWKRFMKN